MPKKVGVLIRQKRLALGLTQQQLGIPVLQVIRKDEEPQLRFLVDSITLGQAELAVLGLARCIRDGQKPGVGSKFGAQLALARVAADHPERESELQKIRGRLNDLFP